MSSNACDIWQNLQDMLQIIHQSNQFYEIFFMKSVGKVNGITRSYTANSVTETVQFLFHVSNKVTRK